MEEALTEREKKFSCRAILVALIALIKTKMKLQGYKHSPSDRFINSQTDEQKLNTELYYQLADSEMSSLLAKRPHLGLSPDSDI